MASRIVSSGCARFISLQSHLTKQKAFIPGAAKLLSSISNNKDVGPNTVRARPYSTAPTNSFFAPPRPLARVSETSPTSIVDVAITSDSKQLVVSWEGGDSQIYPFVWLRDNCRCSKCFHPIALCRLTYAHQLNVDITAKSAGISQDGGGVTIQWDDDHQSQFPSYWLREYRFDESPVDQLLNPQYRLWDRDIDLQTFEFNRILHDDQTLTDWLTELVVVGIAVVTDTPREVGQLSKLADRSGAFLRQQNYGPTFQVKSKVDPSNPAYTTGALALHTDLAYYIRQPGIQMLHCIEQALGSGGENIFSDGFKVAMDLKKDDPEAFHLLTTVNFEFFDKGKDFYGEYYQNSQHPIIQLNNRGEIDSISVSDHGRDPMLRAPVHQVQPIYRALHKYCNMLLEPENLLQYKMREGDIVTFNNRRALHGRNAFQVTKTSGRHLEGGYLEWDEVNSRLRVLAMQLQNQKSRSSNP